MEFEYDPEKSRTNKTKHGIDFEESMLLWDDEDRLIIPADFEDEERFVMFSLYKARVWTTIFTVRNDRIRIISVRRSRKDEIEAYES